MNRLHIYLDPNHPQYQELVSGLQVNLRALESVRVDETKRTVQPGTLGFGTQQVLSFVVERSTEILAAAASLMTLINQLIAFSRRAGVEASESKPVTIVSGNARLSLPASPEAQRQFLKKIKEGASATKQASIKRRKPKKPNLDK